MKVYLTMASCLSCSLISSLSVSLIVSSCSIVSAILFSESFLSLFEGSSRDKSKISRELQLCLDPDRKLNLAPPTHFN